MSRFSPSRTDVLPVVLNKRRHDACRGERDAGDQVFYLNAPGGDDGRAVGIGEGRNVPQERRVVGQVGQDVHEVQHEGSAQSDAQTVAPQEGGEAEHDAADLQLHEKIAQKHVKKQLVVNCLADGKAAQHGGGRHGEVEDQDLGGHGQQLLGHHVGAGDGMGQQELRCALPLLLGQGGDAQQRRKKRAAQPQHVAAFHGKVAAELAEVDLVHVEGLGEAAHLGEHVAHVAHLGGHLGIDDDADEQHGGDGGGPHDELDAIPLQLMEKQCHLTRPPLCSSAGTRPRCRDRSG